MIEARHRWVARPGWGRWRDRDAAEHYWLACDMGAAGAVPVVLPEVMRRLLAQGKIDLFLDMLTHRARPSQVLAPPRLLGATGRLLTRRGCERGPLLREVGSLIAADVRHKWLNRQPAYAPNGQTADTPTEGVADSTPWLGPGRELNMSSAKGGPDVGG